jgi:predicted kinase
MLVVMAGLPGTGKSTLANAIAPPTGGVVLDKDRIRAALFGNEVDYSTAQDDFVMNLMLQTAAWFLARNRQRIVILDGRVFSKNSQLERVTDFASKLGIPWLVIECICTDETACRRLEQERDNHPAENRTSELYEKLKRRFEPIPQPKTIISTEQPLADCIDRALYAIRSHLE